MAAQLLPTTTARPSHVSGLETMARARARTTLTRGLLVAAAVSEIHAVDVAPVFAVPSSTVAVAGGATACLVAGCSYLRTAYVRPYWSIRRRCAAASLQPFEGTRRASLIGEQLERPVGQHQAAHR